MQVTCKMQSLLLLKKIDKKSEASLSYIDNSRETQHINKKVCVCASMHVHVCMCVSVCM